jgi:hypothetical protein
MSLLNQKSLYLTLENINDAFFHGEKIARAERIILAEWISSRQGIKGSYAQMPAPTDSDFSGITVFTGEAVKSRAAIAHILGEEATRMLILLGVKNKNTTNSIRLSTEGMLERIKEAENDRYRGGTYCCGICSVSYWRHLLAGGLRDQDKFLSLGLRALKDHRSQNSQWHRFPYYYTLLALDEMLDKGIAVKQVLAEIKYASGKLEKTVRTKFSQRSKYVQRRLVLAERILSKMQH